MKGKLKGAVMSIARSISKHSPELLTASGIALVGTSLYLAIKASFTSKAELDDIEVERQIESSPAEPLPELTPREKLECVWKNYIPTAIAFGAGVTCLAGSTKISIGRTAAATLACKFSEGLYEDLQESIKKNLAEKKAIEVHQGAVKEAMDRTSDSETCEVFDTGKGGDLFYDYYSGRYFTSNAEAVRQAFNVIVANAAEGALTENGIARVYLNDFYEVIGLPDIKAGDIIGWRFKVGAGHDIRPMVVIGAIPTKYGAAANTVDFNIRPNFDIEE